jgi:prepilin-type processing-associated H-X9-DG protein
MPISYAMNSCATTWYPADTKEGRGSPPLRNAQLTRAADTILMSEIRTIWPDTHPAQLWSQCYAIFGHKSGGFGQFLYFDGHAKTRKWLATLYPLHENQWELQPNPDPNNRTIRGPIGCQYVAPASASSREYQAAQCKEYQ